MLVGGSAELAAAYADHWSVSGDIAAQLAALADACHSLGRDRSTITVSADSPAEGVDEWVVPDSALGPEPSGWPGELSRIRAADAMNRRLAPDSYEPTSADKETPADTHAPWGGHQEGERG